jgi:hypothetical protein
MTMAAEARMWESKMFTKDQLVLWENKPTANQTWQALQDYFTEKWLERRQYLQATAKHSRFKDAALAAQTGGSQGGRQSVGNDVCTTTRAAQDITQGNGDGKPKAMEATFEQINAIVGGQCKVVDKENTLPATGNTGKSTGGTKRNRKKCTHCRKHVFHKPSDCYELEANTSKHWTWWKSVNDAGIASA